MHELIGSLLDNDSIFGKIMTRFGIIIGANLMFILFSMPVVTAGAAYTALYHVMFKTLRGDGVVNPFKQFWIGFKNNFIQSTIVWILTIGLVVIFYMEFRITGYMSGAIEGIRYALVGVAAILAIVVIYMFPVIAAFADTIPHLLRNAMFFAMRKPFKMIVILFFNVFPMYLTYSDPQMMPLYAFLWVFFGFGAVAMLGAVLLLPEFKPFLPAVDDEGNFIDPQTPEEAPAAIEEKSEKETLDDMKKMGM